MSTGFAFMNKARYQNIQTDHVLHDCFGGQPVIVKCSNYITVKVMSA